MIQITNKDIVYSYLAQFFNLASGIITLPLILSMLSTEEIAMNYLMLTVGSLVSLFDFGFSPQFGRNIAYVFSGSKRLVKEGIIINEDNKEVDYRLLATMIKTARFIYKKLSIAVLILLLTFGSWYIGIVTDGFTIVKNSILIWILFSISIFFNIYYTYYSSLLIGKGQIMESKKSLIFSRLGNIVLVFTFLYLNLGLLGVSLANLLSPFIQRWFSNKYFFTRKMNILIGSYNINKDEILNLFGIIWHNSKKLGLVYIGRFAISKFGLFLAGLYLSSTEIASYGLMIQLTGVIIAISSTLINAFHPKFSSLRVIGNKSELLEVFSYSLIVFYVLYLSGAIFLLFGGSYILNLIGSNAELPDIYPFLFYLIFILLEQNHSHFASLIISNNNVPFVKSSLIVGLFIAILSYLSLKYTSLGITGIILTHGLTQLAYSNWKWPSVILKDFNVSYIKILNRGFLNLIFKFKSFNINYAKQ